MSSSVHSKAAPEPPAAPRTLEQAEARIRELTEQVAELEARVRELERTQAPVRGAAVANDDAALLREREAMFAEVERLARVGSWLWDVRSNEVAWSEQFFRIFGYEPKRDRASLENFYAALHPDDRARMADGARISASTGVASPGIQCRVVRPEGEVRHVFLGGAPLHDAHGQLTHLVGAALDVTEFVRVETELRRTTELLNEAQRLAGIGSYVWQNPGGVLEWSETLYHLFGIEPGTPVDDDLFVSLIDPADRERVHAACKSSIAGDLKSVEYRVIRPDGTRRHVYMEMRPEVDTDGRLLRHIGTVQDVTQRRQLEEQLRHSQKMDAIGTLAGGIAHDFNNYMLVIQGNLQLLRSELADRPGAEELLTELSSAASSCSSLTRQLLAFARRQPSAPRAVDVSGLVAESARVLRRIVGDGIELSLETTPGQVVCIDPSHVEQILVNLVVNARDAMPRGGKIRVEVARQHLGAADVSSRPELTTGDYVRVSVEDEGEGIAPALHPRIFEPFFTTKEQGRGTGLGLATVYGIVQQAKGHVEFDSALGRGSRFVVWLPSAANAEQRGERSSEVAQAPGARSVLVVDDDPRVRRLVCRMLEHAGHRVLTAECGEEALRCFEQEGPIDLLLTDVRMPRMSGVQLASRLKDADPGLAVLLMSGYADAAGAEIQKSGLADALIEKPFGAADLLDRVSERLDERDRTRASAHEGAPRAGATHPQGAPR